MTNSSGPDISETTQGDPLDTGTSSKAEALKALRSWIAVEILSPDVHNDGKWHDLATNYGGKLCTTSLENSHLQETPVPLASDTTPWPSEMSEQIFLSSPSKGRKKSQSQSNGSIDLFSYDESKGKTSDIVEHEAQQAQPSHNGQRQKRNWYHIVLGALPAGQSIKALNESFNESEDTLPSERLQPTSGKIIAATIILNEWGLYVPDTLAIASFAWGLGNMLSTGDASLLPDWRAKQTFINSEIEDILTQIETGEPPHPLSWSDLIETSYILRDKLKIPKELWLGVQCAIVVERERPPPGDLLCSLYLNDLETAAATLNRAPTAFAEYMGIKKPRDPWNALKDRSRISNLLYPGMFPLARWPGPGLHPLNVLQQAAVNNICYNLSREGLEAVNGPPGTGKTFLLRDIVAHVMLSRAEHLAMIKDPNMGIGQINLLDFAIVVASSNNAAVENVSLELPIRSKSLDESIWLERGLDHFGKLASFVLDIPEESDEGNKAWGVIAAKLGNSRNRKNFFEKFWWNESWGLSNWMARAANPDSINLVGKKPGKLEEHYPPPRRPEAMARWQKARDDFQQALDRCHKIRDELSGVCDTRSIRMKGEISIPVLTEQNRQFTLDLESAKRACEAASIDVQINMSRLEAETAKLTALTSNRVSEGENTNAQIQRISNNIDQLQTSLIRSRKRYLSCATERDRLIASIRHNDRVIATVGNEKELETNQEEPPQSSLGPKEGFWSLPHELFHAGSPWNEGEFKAARDDLFVASVNLHHAFVVAGARKIRSAIKSIATNQAEPNDWGMFFLIIPVVSTTFASIGKTFNNLGQGSLGWVLIDEGGQATPQAAVGAIWRSKRTVVIGDQQQIEPVVTIPPRSTELIFRENKSDPKKWAAPEISAQSLADRANEAQGHFPTDNPDLPRVTGFPLLVHRRCDKVMFDIANHLAYGGEMIHATQPGPSAIRDLLGQSSWVNISAPSQDKWVEMEGRAVTIAISGICERLEHIPDIYVISPFRQPIRHLKQMIRRNAANQVGFKGIDRRKLSRWVSSNIGTIHTFQGKQAEAVILLLGAGSGAKSSSRIWAGKTPNILNVASTRAQRCLYVVGNKREWENVGSFKIAAKFLPTIDAKSWLSKIKDDQTNV
ncbi:DEAD/DEAH box helicase [Acetobacter pasteurianus]|uniref:DEAD/DEAH box helicase n=1 Tax=Acetobacter pasteurianus TaxID=438 RepID=UPI0013631570|nr:ATP-binding protein [Acetobacter pasteurianus]QHM90151.2 AAA domain-containing protein [Acetobacter pasteurianus]